MSPLWPRMMAAPIGPTPYTSVTDVFDAMTAVTVRARVSAKRQIEEGDLGHELGAGGNPLEGDRITDSARQPGASWLAPRSGTGRCHPR